METPNPKLIRLVASRYRELQGLLTIVDAGFPLYLGVMMMAAGWMERAGVSDWFAFLFGVPLLAFMVAQFRWLRPRILAYYNARFGRVQGPYAFSASTTMYQGLMLSALLADARMPWLTVLLVFASLGAWPAWIVWRDWPYRWHWLPTLVLAMMTSGYMSLMPSYHVALQHLGRWALAFGASLAVAGLGDHLLLVRTLKPGAHDNEAPQHA